MSTILTTIAQMQAAGLDLDKNTKIEVLNPHIDAAEKNFLLPVLGAAFYQVILDELEEETPGEAITTLLPYLQKPLAWNGYYLFFKKPIGSLSHTGFYNKTFDHSTKPPKWEVDKLIEELICSADKALDELAAFLRENLEDYPTWEESAYFSKNSILLIPTASQFDKYVKIGCSSRVYQRLLFFREQAERNIKKTICPDFYQVVIDQISGSEELTEEITSLIPYLQAVIAFDTMRNAILQIPFYRYGADVLTWTYADGTLTKSGITLTEAREISAMYDAMYEDARAELIAFLNDNIADYPDYASSPCYSTEPRTLVVKYDNDPLKKHFGI